MNLGKSVPRVRVSRAEVRNMLLSFIGLAKKFILDFPLHSMEKPKHIFWPVLCILCAMCYYRLRN